MKSLALAALVVFSLVAIGGQAQTGMIGGTVRDSSGATIPGVTVTATHIDTGKVTALVTNENGTYTFSNLPAGTYAVNAELLGFTPRRFTGVTLGPASSVRQDFVLTVQPRPSPFERTANADIVADSQTSRGVVTTYRGHVRMTTDSVIIEADELDFDSQTQQANVRGNVSVQLRKIGPRVIPLTRLP